MRSPDSACVIGLPVDTVALQRVETSVFPHRLHPSSSDLVLTSPNEPPPSLAVIPAILQPDLGDLPITKMILLLVRLPPRLMQLGQVSLQIHILRHVETL